MSRLTYVSVRPKGFGRRHACCLALLVPVVLAGCSGQAPTAAPAATTATTATTTGTTPATTPAPAPTTPTALTPSEPPVGPVADRCGPPRAKARWITYGGPENARLAAVEIGTGPTTAVFLHQTGAEGLCGFWAYAVWLSDTQDVRTLLVDQCNVGGSVCTEGDFAYDQVAQATLAVQWLRDHDAEQVTLVGASKGAAIAISTAGRQPGGIDSVVVLSAPVPFVDIGTVEDAAAITMPALFAGDRDDPSASYPDLKEAFSRVKGSPKRFLTGDGHGWDLLGRQDGSRYVPSSVGRTVGSWTGTPTGDLSVD